MSSARYVGFRPKEQYVENVLAPYSFDIGLVFSKQRKRQGAGLTEERSVKTKRNVLAHFKDENGDLCGRRSHHCSHLLWNVITLVHVALVPVITSFLNINRSTARFAPRYQSRAAANLIKSTPQSRRWSTPLYIFYQRHGSYCMLISYIPSPAFTIIIC